MHAAGRLASFGAGLLVLFGAAMQLGDAVGPIGDSDSGGHDGHSVESTSEHVDVTPGTQLHADGYTLVTADHVLPAGGQTTFRFQIVDEDGTPQRTFEQEHGAPMHLVLARRDLSGFQHLHPVVDRVGTWSVDIAPLEPGSYRAFADFIPSSRGPGDGHGAVSTVLGVDVDVPGLFEPRPLPAPSVLSPGDPYSVKLEGRLVPGTSSLLRMTVRRNGVPVRDLQPYLESPAHLVVLRTGDLAYLHVHPVTTERTGPGQVVFEAEVPTAGSYRMYLEYQHLDVVRRAEFTVDAEPAEDGNGHDH